MENRDEHIERLITRYFSGEALPDEAIELEEWIDESPDNKRYFEEFRFVTQQLGPAKKYIKVNTLKAWETVSGQMKPSVKSVAVKVSLPVYKKTWFGIAASIIVVLGLSVYMMIFRSDREKLLPSVAIVSNDSILNRKLSPAVQVAINRNSNLTYLTSKTGKKSEIEIRGEAFIEVTHSSDTTLVVRADETFIRDIGTSFNVKAYPEENTVEVYVESGKIQFYTKEQEGITLTQGETGVYNKFTKEFAVRLMQDPNVTSYKTKAFVFRNTSLSDAVKRLNEIYPQKIFIADPDLADYTITVTFDNEPLDSLVEIMAETLNIGTRKDSTGFVLYARQ